MGGSSSRHQRKSTKRYNSVGYRRILKNGLLNYRNAKDSVQSPERAQPGGASAGAAAADILEVKINISDLKDGE